MDIFVPPKLGPPTLIAPANVEVAALEVALIDATAGVEVETMVPAALVPRSMVVPAPPRRKLFVTKFVAKKFVVVAEVEVLLTAVKFWRVDDAVERNPWRVGSVPKTSDPVPVSSVIRDASFAEVSSDEDEILLLKTPQSDDESFPFAVRDANGRLKV